MKPHVSGRHTRAGVLHAKRPSVPRATGGPESYSDAVALAPSMSRASHGHCTLRCHSSLLRVGRCGAVRFVVCVCGWQVFAAMVKSMLYEKRFGPFFVEPLIAGLEDTDTEKNGQQQ